MAALPEDAPPALLPLSNFGGTRLELEEEALFEFEIGTLLIFGSSADKAVRRPGGETVGLLKDDVPENVRRGKICGANNVFPEVLGDKRSSRWSGSSFIIGVREPETPEEDEFEFSVICGAFITVETSAFPVATAIV